MEWSERERERERKRRTTSEIIPLTGNGRGENLRRTASMG